MCARIRFGWFPGVQKLWFPLFSKQFHPAGLYSPPRGANHAYAFLLPEGMFVISFLRHRNQMSEGTKPSWGAITSI